MARGEVTLLKDVVPNPLQYRSKEGENAREIAAEGGKDIIATKG